MRIFFLDDSNERVKKFRKNSVGHNVDYAESAEQAIEMLKRNRYDLIYLDHDLAAEHYNGSYTTAKTGYDVAKKLAEYEHLYGAIVFAHTLNHSGALNILSVLKHNFEVYLPEQFDTVFMWDLDVNDVLERIKQMKGSERNDG
jgi:CheY-like chemotaxis protein